MHLRTLLLAFLVAAPAAAFAIPVTVPYSGQLSENGALVNGVHSLTFRLYPVPAGGTLLATHTEALNLVRGVYHTELTFDDTIWSLAEDRWVGVSVDGESELPRVRIGFVPFAVRALETAAAAPGVNYSPSGGPTVAVVGSTTWTRCDTVGITAPADGHAWVAATVNVQTQTPTSNTHDINIVLSESPPPASPVDQIRSFEPMGASNARTFSHTQVFPVSAGHHTFGVYVRQTLALTAGATTSFTRVTLQAMWLPRLYP